jgi:hypothetical protein
LLILDQIPSLLQTPQHLNGEQGVTPGMLVQRLSKARSQLIRRRVQEAIDKLPPFGLAQINEDSAELAPKLID